MIGVVIVTFNRLEKLKVALESFDAQTSLPDYVLVVDNMSTDGTRDYLADWSKAAGKSARHVVLSESNLGGSGGFYLGLQAALSLDSEWVWVSDDDAFPEPNSLEIAEKYLRDYENHSQPLSALCGKVVKNGIIDTWHRRSIEQVGSKIVDSKMPESCYERESFEINELTYVGSIISKRALQEVGLTQKDYFIYEDDAEHSLRLSKVGRIVCIPSIVINHDAPEDVYRYTWKTYYSERNRLDLIRRHFPRSVYQAEYRRRKIRAIVRALARRDIEVWRLFNSALHDVKHGVFGMHDVYKPGWRLDYRYDD